MAMTFDESSNIELKLVAHATTPGDLQDEVDKNGVNGSIGASNSETNLEDSDDEGQKNPLFIDVIIQRVLEYCELESLFSCRLVCKKWNPEAWNQIKKRNLIVIRSIDRIPNYLRSSLHLNRLGFFNFNVKQNSSELESLLATTGAHVKDLVLNFNDKQLDFDELKLILTRMPNLERLNMTCLPCDLFRQQKGDVISEETHEMKPLLKLRSLSLRERCHFEVERPGESERFFLKLLSYMPNLEELTGALGWSASHLFKALNSSHLPNLAHLGIVGAFNRESAAILEKLRLRSIYLGVGTHYNDDNHHNVIYAQRETLQTLGLGWSSFHSRVTSDQLASEFPQLKCLSLCDASKWEPQPCPKTYLTAVGIQKFQVDIRIVTDFEFVALNPCFGKVKDLDISFSLKWGSVCERGDICLSTLRATFPTLRSLTLRAPLDFPFGYIFKLFADLDELAIHFVSSPDDPEDFESSGYLDSLLTGIEESDCDYVRPRLEGRNDVAFVTDQAQALLHIARDKNGPGMPLSNLQNLKKLSIITFRGKNISCVTVQLCLWIMPRLASITIVQADLDVEETLRKVFPPTTFLHIGGFRDSLLYRLRLRMPSEKRFQFIE